MEELQIDNTLIRFDENNFKINEFRICDLDLRSFLDLKSSKIQFHFNPLLPNNCNVDFPKDFETNFQYTLSVIGKVFNKNKCLSAKLSSDLFGIFTSELQHLLHQGNHILGIHLFEALISLVNNSENDNSIIHKGALYYWLSVSYLLVGNFDAAFTFLFNALEEDRKLEDICDGYPEMSPSYLTATLAEDKNNFMYLYIEPVRNWLRTFIDSYNTEFTRTLTIEKLFDHFKKNKSNHTIFLYFIFNIWSIFGYRKNIVVGNLNNDYMKLKNSSWLFNFCLVIDTLLTNLSVKGKDFGERFYEFIELKNWMIKDELKNKIIKMEKVAYEQPDLIIKTFLRKYFLNGNILQKEIRYLIIAYNIRNFSAHNVKPQKLMNFSRYYYLIFL